LDAAAGALAADEPPTLGAGVGAEPGVDPLTGVGGMVDGVAAGTENAGVARAGVAAVQLLGVASARPPPVAALRSIEMLTPRVESAAAAAELAG
jgi:hypothetical protein